MRTSLILLAGASIMATPALAQPQASAPAAASTQTTPSTAPASGTATTPASGAAAASTQAGAAAPASGTAAVTVGASVSDASGAPVGTVESIANGTATVSTGTAKAGLPVSAFAKGPNGLVIGMTKAQVEAAVAQAAPAEIAVGATVNDSKGAKVGTVEAVSGDMVTVATANAKAQLPKKAFAQSSGALVIGMTASELEAAAKAAAPTPKPGS